MRWFPFKSSDSQVYIMPVLNQYSERHLVWSSSLCHPEQTFSFRVYPTLGNTYFSNESVIFISIWIASFFHPDQHFRDHILRRVHNFWTIKHPDYPCVFRDNGFPHYSLIMPPEWPNCVLLSVVEFGTCIPHWFLFFHQCCGCSCYCRLH